MSKKVVTNTWNDGLNKDLNPTVTPNTVLTDNLNGTFVTYNGNELTLQNDMGNIETVHLTDGFYPIGIAEYEGVVYIASVNTSKPVQSTSTTIVAAQYEVCIQGQNAVRSVAEYMDSKNYELGKDYTYDTSGSNEYWVVTDNISIANDALNTFLNRGYNCWQLHHDIKNITTNTTTSNSGKYAFEIGSFPSLNPSNATYKALENGEIESTFENKYRPLHNMIRGNGVSQQLCDFNTSKLEGYDLQHPVHIEIQPSYDGSVNLILSDDKNPIRLINSGFAVTENGKGKFVKRNQGVKTNYYREDNINQLTRLIKTTTSFTGIDLDRVEKGGKMKGGNYVFYVKLGDEDGNKTDIVAESGIVSIFHGTIGDPKTISGAFANEVTDKMVTLTITAIDPTYSKIYISYVRETCDLNGIRVTEACEIVEPYTVDGEQISITINGLEEVENVSIEDFNINYYDINSAKSITQQQGMLFLGNVDLSVPDSSDLQNLSYKIKVSVKQGDSIGNVDGDFYNPIGADTMYYDPSNIYYKLGYWPDELYRFGIVYIKSGGITTQVYNLKGCVFENLNELNLSGNHTYNFDFKQTIVGDNGDNIVGVFKTPNADILTSKSPIYFNFEIDKSTQTALQAQGVTGYFIVRQKRIPITICQGMATAINNYSFYPMACNVSGPSFISESFLTDYGDGLGQLEYNPTYNVGVSNSKSEWKWYIYQSTVKKPVCINLFGSDIILWYRDATVYSLIGPYNDIADYCHKSSESYDTIFNELKRHSNRINTIQKKNTYNNDTYNTNRQQSSETPLTFIVKPDNIEENAAGLISVEANVNKEIQSMLNGTSFDVVPYLNQKGGLRGVHVDYYLPDGPNKFGDVLSPKTVAKLTYIPEGTAYKNVDGVGFSNKVGDGINPQEFGYIEDSENITDSEGRDWVFKPIRGEFAPYIAVSGNFEGTNTATIGKHDIRCNATICNVRIPTSGNYASEIIARGTDNSPFYAVSQKTQLKEGLNVYRGDCYICKTTVRMHRNFIDQNAPIAEQIVHKECWSKWFRGVDNVLDIGDDQETDDNGDISEETKKTDWSKINIGDLNTVALGHWVSFYCLANTNIGLRSSDTTNSSEIALMGNPRSFYPLVGMSTRTGMKLADSNLFNHGYDATVGQRRYYFKEEVPYDKSEFSTRIMFSNVSVTDSFINGYRVFQGLSYKDYTKQYGSIIKLLPWGNNLFVVFEHGLAIAPVNEKALLQTTTEQTIHIYGHGVLTDQLTIISQDFGSTWADSVIRTPIGIYGFDTSAKKIWRYTDNKGLEIISDLHIQRFLNDNAIIDPNQSVSLGVTDVRTHYNNYKGDVMFVFYNGETSWNMCYNERQGLWVTRYSWTPLMSINVDNTFYSINKNERDNHFRIFKHGRTGVDSEFRPCSWYGEQHPFEFEFVVKDPIEFHKIFDNLRIISNNVQPSTIEFEFVGDTYLFNRSKIYNNSKNLYGNGGNDVPYNVDVGKDLYRNKSDYSNMFYNARVNYDNVIDQYTLVLKQSCKNKDSYGVRLGNIQYKEDGWYTNIEPLRYDSSLNNATMDYRKSGDMVSTKIRDKWIKVRIIYTGDRLALINAVSTFETLSYA